MVSLRRYVFFLFVFEKAKNVGRSDDDKRRKKRGWPNKYAREISEKSLEQKSELKLAQNSAVKLCWNFKNKLLSGRRRHQFEFLGKEIQCLLILKTKADCLSCHSLKGTF